MLNTGIQPIRGRRLVGGGAKAPLLPGIGLPGFQQAIVMLAVMIAVVLQRVGWWRFALGGWDFHGLGGIKESHIFHKENLISHDRAMTLRSC